VPIRVSLKAIHQTKWHEYALRFVLGGAVTVLTGLIAKEFGPVVGGLFLAFPAILQSTVAQNERHESERKGPDGQDGRAQGTQAAGVDAFGTMLGSAGLAAFAALVWRFLPTHGPLVVLTAATVAWIAVSVIVWWSCRRWVHAVNESFREHPPAAAHSGRGRRARS